MRKTKKPVEFSKDEQIRQMRLTLQDIENIKCTCGPRRGLCPGAKASLVLAKLYGNESLNE